MAKLEAGVKLPKKRRKNLKRAVAAMLEARVKLPKKKKKKI